MPDDILSALRDLKPLQTFRDQRLGHALSLSHVEGVVKSFVDWGPPDPLATPRVHYNNPDLLRLMLDDEWCRTYWPPRSKRDLSIRITRYRDLSRYCQKMHLDLTEPVLLFPHCDYIWMLNMLWSWILVPTIRPLFRKIAYCDLAQFLTVSKKINNYLKVNGPYLFNVDLVLEFGALTGYRFLDSNLFDELEEARKLVCKNDLVFNFPPGTDFRYWADRTRTSTGPPKWLSFSDYVQGFVSYNGDESIPWLTSGSSSKGYLYYEADGVVKKLKCRKNLVPYVYDLVELTEEARRNAKQENWTVVKNELAKVRLAVSSDILTYLQQSWLLYLTNGFYSLWPGSSLGETLEEEEQRLALMMVAVKNNYSLPWDFDGFDHQPKQEQLAYLAQIVVDTAYSNFPVPEVLAIGSRMVQAFAHSTLTVKRLGIDVPVQDGLLSGLRYTSLFGNQWNTIISNIVVDIIYRYTGQRPIDLQIRGDDTSLTYTSQNLCEVACALYSHIGARGGEGKFSVRYNNTEFLRQHIYPDHISGYVQRSIPGLTQRKPWNPEPWSASSVIQKVVDTVNLLSRRGAECRGLAESMCSVWCQKQQVPMSVCRTPKYYGGLQLLPFDGQLCSLVVDTKLNMSFTNLTSFGVDRWSAVAQKLQIPASADHIAALAHRDLMNMISADDVPDISRLMRQKTKVTFKKLEHKPPRYMMTPQQPDVPVISMEYGSASSYAADIRNAQALLPEKSRFKRWLEDHIPALKFIVHARDFTRRLDWLLGDISVPVGPCNPKMSKHVSNSVINYMSRIKWSDRHAGTSALLAQQNYDIWWNSTIHQRLYMN